MDTKTFQKDLVELLKKYDALALAIVSIAYTDGEKIHCWGQTFIPVPPRDHEEELLRDHAAKEASNMAANLVKNTYLGR